LAYKRDGRARGKTTQAARERNYVELRRLAAVGDFATVTRLPRESLDGQSSSSGDSAGAGGSLSARMQSLLDPTRDGNPVTEAEVPCKVKRLASLSKWMAVGAAAPPR